MTTTAAGPAGPIGLSTAFGTFGELLQGVLPGRNGDFLVTLPIARWSVATFQALPTTGVRVYPPHKAKAQRLAEMIVGWAGHHGGGALIIDSTLPEGKGLASSSADLVATARAVGNALRIRLPDSRIEQFMARIEPTDGVLYPAIVAYDHRRVRLRHRLGSLPAVTVVGVDEGGMVDTVEFNRIAKPFSAKDRQEYARLLDRMCTAVARRDLGDVGTIATRSAELNQLLRPKRLLAELLALRWEVGALGVVAAHSGTMLGVLLDPADPQYVAKLGATVAACTSLCDQVTIYRTLSFGP